MPDEAAATEGTKPAPVGAEPAAPAAPPTPDPATEAPEAAPVEDWESRFKYLLADFENFRRRSARDREQAQQTGRAKVLAALLPLWEALDRAETAARRLPEKDPLRAGLDLVRKEWEQFLKAQHLAPVAKVGEPFRPDDHEAIGETPATEKLRDGRVSEVVQQGYRSDAGLLRPAKVLVARKPAPPPEDPPAAPADRPEVA